MIKKSTYQSLNHPKLEVKVKLGCDNSVHFDDQGSNRNAIIVPRIVKAKVKYLC